MKFQRRTSQLALLVLACLLTTACGDTNEPPDGGGTSTVDSIPMDGILLLSFGNSLAVLDTKTAVASYLYATVSPASVAVSPDSQRVAYGTVDGVTIARVTVDENGPSLIAEHMFSNEQLGGPFRSTLRWTPDGEQLVYNDGVIDPESGEVFVCEPRHASKIAHATLIPGGHDVVCGTDRSLRSNGNTRAAEVSGLPSSDGQFLSYGTHVPTGAQPADNDQSAPIGGDVVMPGNEFGSFPSGAHGDYIVAESAGFVTLYKRMNNPEPPGPGTLYHAVGDVSSTNGDGTPSVPERWRLADALLPFFTDGEGRGYSPVGISPDGNDIFYVVRSYNIAGDSFTNALHEETVENALVRVPQNGEPEGFRTNSFDLSYVLGTGRLEAANQPDSYPEHLKPTFAVDLGQGDVIVPFDFVADGRPDSWAGWHNGEPWVGKSIGTISPDGRQFATIKSPEAGQAATVCITELSPTERTRCLTPTYGFEGARVLDFVGLDVKAEHKADAPRILSTSRAAAYDGSNVSVFGVRFGQSGTVRIGDTEVPASSISEWSDNRITFAMSSALPDSGAIEVETSTSTTRGQRLFWLHHTKYVSNDFDDVPFGRVTFKQGLNEISLGGLTDIEFRFPYGLSLIMFPELASEDGNYVIYSKGSRVAFDDHATLISGEMSRRLDYTITEDLADPSLWQPVFLNAGSDRRSMFARRLGELSNVERIGLFAYSNGGRVNIVSPYNDPVSPYWRVTSDDSGMWRIGETRGYPSRLYLQTGWSPLEQSSEVRAVFSGTGTTLPIGLNAVEDAGDIVLATGMTGQTAGYALSTDNGQTFGEPVGVLTTMTELREPIRIDAEDETFFLVMSSPSNGPGLLGVHAISLDGTFTENFATIPDGNLSGGLTYDQLPVSFARRGGELVLYFPFTNTLVYAEFDETPKGDAMYTWTTLPAAEAGGHVVSIYHEDDAVEVYAVLDDGTVMRTTSDWTQWEVFDLQFDLSIPTTVVPRSIGRLTDGRWLVDAALYDARPGIAAGTPSPLSDAAYLVSPAP